MTNEFTLKNLNNYNFPTKDDMCVGLCYFNPIGYKNLKENLHIVIQSLTDSRIPFYVIELIYPNQNPSVPQATKVVKAETVVFCKENLWNILEQSIPDKYSKIIFLDSDIKFNNPDWFNLSSTKLDDCNIIQPMDVIFRDLTDKYSPLSIISTDQCQYTVAHAIESFKEAKAPEHYPGFSIGIRRDTFHSIGKFFEYGFGGNGDFLFWMAVSNFYSHLTGKFLEMRRDIAEKFYLYKANCYKTQIKIGATFDNMAIHLFHGSIKNRKYGDLSRYIFESKYRNNFYHNSDNVLEMKDDESIYEYLKNRNEDEQITEKLKD